MDKKKKAKKPKKAVPSPYIRFIKGSVKLKDKYRRDMVFVDLTNSFGFLPATICVQKVKGSNNRIRIGAIVQVDQQKRELEIIKKLKAEEAKKTAAAKKKDKIIAKGVKNATSKKD